MKIRIQERHMEESDTLRDYAVKNAEQLEKFFDGIISVEITMDVEKERRIAQVFAHLIHKKVVKASAESEDMYISLDSALDKVERQLKKYKEKLKEKDRGSTIRKELAQTNPSDGSTDTDSGEDNREVVKTDMYFKKPMSVDEAVMQLESYQNDFLVFINSEDDRLNIIYSRDDGRYGLIEPQASV
ncbi:MAG: ribosome hibernation-promoting factor, HPF/YfiA family [Candidatus Bipolaricaulota bacterium]